jgi:hypothetical protein
MTKLTTMTRTADDATRGEGRMTTTNDESGRWTMQGDNNGSDNSGGDVVALAVTSAGIDGTMRAGGGGEKDVVMAADGYRQLL